MRMRQVAEETFLYDDFFSPADDPGIEIRPMIRGREVPLRIKRGISLVDAGEARDLASKKALQNGTPVVVDVNETRMNILILKRVILSWPFVKKDGSPVPITEKTIGELVGDAAQAILEEIQALMSAREESLAPFAKRSGKD
jgi:hypothetical protein